MKTTERKLAATVVIGPHRDRARRLLDALYAQTCLNVMEIVLVDVAPDDLPDLDLRPDVPTSYARLPENTPWAHARGTAVRLATAPIAACLEEHCYPEPGWAEALIEAHQGPWAAVGYAFTNANPETYVSRVSMVTDYGPFLHPVPSGPRRFITGSNVAYKRELLLSLGEPLEALLSIDFNVHQIFNKRGLPMYLESRALVAHENFTSLFELLHSNHVFCRLLALGRVRSESWGLARRLVYGLAVPAGAPALKLARLVYSLRGRRPLWREFTLAMPLIVPVYVWSAIGESLGYLLPQGSTRAQFNWWEIEAERAPAAERDPHTAPDAHRRPHDCATRREA